MIRKTFICAAGLLAGVSTGAYVDGYFEEDNIVTQTYQQLTDGSAPSVEVADDIRSNGSNSASGPNGPDVSNSLVSASSPIDGSQTDVDGAKMRGDQIGSGSKLANKDTKNNPSEAGSGNSVAGSAIANGSENMMADASSAVKKDKMPEAETDIKSVMENSISDADDQKQEEQRTDELRTDSRSKTAANKTAAEKEAERDKARSMALLDVRFTKEVYRSPDGGELKYRKLSPRTAGDTGKLPLVIFLHGLGERGDDNVSQLKHGLDFFASQDGMREFPATIIAPQCPNGERWSTGDLEPTPTEPMRMTQELIASLASSPEVDPRRIYVTGLSMGGFGTFDLIARQPSAFAGAVPLCGGGDTRPEIVERIKQTPLWVIHGDEDAVVDVENSREMVKALRQTGASPRYSELAGFGHNIWDAAYADEELYKWLFSQSKSPGSSSMASVKQTSNSEQTSAIDPNASSDAKMDMLKQSLQGDWRVLAATQRGRRANSATLEKMKIEISGNNLIIAIGDKIESATFELPSSNGSLYPLIDIVSQKESVRNSTGIFAAKGDKLVICWGMPGAARPTTFDSGEKVKTLVLEKK